MLFFAKLCEGFQLHVDCQRAFETDDIEVVLILSIAMLMLLSKSLLMKQLLFFLLSVIL